jgi:hypothetical protein
VGVGGEWGACCLRGRREEGGGVVVCE